jgi:hypothetical protein
MAKHQYVLPNCGAINTANLTNDLNQSVAPMRRKVAEQAITLLAKEDACFFPLEMAPEKEIAYVGIGSDNAFAARLKKERNAQCYFIDPSTLKSGGINKLVDSIVGRHKKIVIGLHQINRAPANRFGMGNETIQFINLLQQRSRSILFVFGNAYAAGNFCAAKNMVICYEDETVTQETAADLLFGKLSYRGQLPVTICSKYPSGAGWVAGNIVPFIPSAHLADSNSTAAIDSVVTDAIKKKQRQEQ